mmetsp:Transcript_34705/g.83985  ORF Transcript_34705/g.83985 Transcript_34705/m.83985 type:complete len:353 (+) Transcript_34705:759-1817(+)
MWPNLYDFADSQLNLIEFWYARRLCSSSASLWTTGCLVLLGFLNLLYPCIPKPDDAIDDNLGISANFSAGSNPSRSVKCEESLPLELIPRKAVLADAILILKVLLDERLDYGRHRLLRVWIDQIHQALRRILRHCLIGTWNREQRLVDSHFRRDAFVGAYPMNSSFHLAGLLSPRFCVWVVRAAKLHHLASFRVLDHFVTLDDVSIPQPHFSSRLQPKELLRGVQHEVVLLNEYFPRQRNLSCCRAYFGQCLRKRFGKQRSFNLFDTAFLPVCDHNFQRIQDRHNPGRLFVQLLANCSFQHCEFHAALASGDSDHFAKTPDCSRWDSSSSNSSNRRHARVVPAPNLLLVDEL